MGQYHYLVNLDKHQFIHPHQIGNGLKLHEQVGWAYATATALVMLLASSSRAGGRGGGDFHCGHPLIGSWAGDKVAFIGDYAEASDIPDCDAPRVYAMCNTACDPQTKDKPDGWEAWTNVSPQVREMMSAEFSISYQGEGWLQIVEADKKSVRPTLRPDLVITLHPVSRN